jgi:hypothetical protein
VCKRNRAVHLRSGCARHNQDWVHRALNRRRRIGPCGKWNGCWRQEHRASRQRRRWLCLSQFRRTTNCRSGSTLASAVFDSLYHLYYRIRAITAWSLTRGYRGIVPSLCRGRSRRRSFTCRRRDRTDDAYCEPLSARRAAKANFASGCCTTATASRARATSCRGAQPRSPRFCVATDTGFPIPELLRIRAEGGEAGVTIIHDKRQDGTSFDVSFRKTCRQLWPRGPLLR